MKQVAIVGGSGGVGNALTTHLLDCGWEVVVMGRQNARDRRVRKFYRADTFAAPWRTLYQAVESDSGAPLNAVAFVSGTAAFGRTALIPHERARQVLELNFWACTAAATAAAEHWAAGENPGKFLAVLSIAARRAVPFESYYCASKAAAERFLACLDLEYGGRGIRFISACPGLLRTAFREQADWYGVQRDTNEGGTDVRTTAQALAALLAGERRRRVLGWRECAIDLADRLFPGLYDRVVLRQRVHQVFNSSPGATEKPTRAGRPT
jgi:NAD(P)-dependent dehydrogenase (short-subunit alcohol dehydrogenase family)